MDSSYFFFLVVPLASLVVFLVALVLYHARDDEDAYEAQVKKLRKLWLSGKLDRKTFVRTRNQVRHEKNFSNESKKLLSLLADEKIDKDTYTRLMHILETSHRDRLGKLVTKSKADDSNEPFDASKFSQ